MDLLHATAVMKNSLRGVLRARKKSAAELWFHCLHMTRNITALCRQAMTVTLGNMALWYPGKNRTQNKGQKILTEDRTGC